MKRLIDVEIDYRPNQRAVSISDPKKIYYRNDNVFVFLYQMEKGQRIHMISYRTTGSIDRARKWAKLARRKLLWDWTRSHGLRWLIFCYLHS